jgi:hypothetical protein
MCTALELARPLQRKEFLLRRLPFSLDNWMRPLPCLIRKAFCIHTSAFATTLERAAKDLKRGESSRDFGSNPR